MEKKPSLLSPFKALKAIFQKPVTIRTPFEHHKTPERYRGFHTNDLDKCIGCGSCARICDNEAIRMVELPNVEEKEGATKMRPVIDYGRCCWCALCVDICPTGSLSMTQEYTHVSADLNTFLILPTTEGIHKKPYPQGYALDEEVNFLDKERVEIPQLKAEERISSFVEIVRGFSQEQAVKEASRCLGCGICTQACPAHMDIPEYIAAIWQEDIEEANRQIYKTNPLPSVCGRVCTHKCESACALNHRGEPVAIRWLKRYALDSIKPQDLEKTLGIDKVVKSKGKKVAIVGSGPAGLACAYYLALMGYKIIVYEKMPQAGGTMRYGIPEYRLPYAALDRDIEIIEKLGVEFVYNTTVGKDISLDKLREEFDAVFAGVGLFQGRSTRIEGADQEGVFRAIELLRQFSLGEEIPVGKKIVVIGGGNVAMDIARTLARLQKNKFGKVDIVVTSLETREIMPADEEEIVEAEEEGIVFLPGRGPKKIEKRGGILRLYTVKCTRVFDESGKFSPQFDESDKKELAGDMIVEAIGQAPTGEWLEFSQKEKLELSGRRIKVNEFYQTSLLWLFVGGDIIKGPDVISAIATGHQAARGIDAFLNK